MLPFRNTSGDPETQPFTDGVHDDLLTQLSKIGSLKVISRTSVEEYREATKSIPEIGRELGVDNIVEGGVQSAGGAFRINVQLIDAESEGHLWAEQYEGELSVANIFQVQSEIAEAITEALRGRLTEDERTAIARTPTEDFDAYQDYLQALSYFHESYLESNFRSADQIVSRVIDRDPTFAEAYALKGATGTMLYWFFFDRSDSIVAASRELIERSLELAPDLPEGHAALGHWYYRTQLDYDQALRELEIARAARPSDAGFETTIASVLRRKGDMEEAIVHFERGAELDPAVRDGAVQRRRDPGSAAQLRRGGGLVPADHRRPPGLRPSVRVHEHDEDEIGGRYGGRSIVAGAHGRSRPRRGPERLHVRRSKPHRGVSGSGGPGRRFRGGGPREHSGLRPGPRQPVSLFPHEPALGTHSQPDRGFRGRGHSVRLGARRAPGVGCGESRGAPIPEFPRSWRLPGSDARRVRFGKAGKGYVSCRRRRKRGEGATG